MDKEKLVEALKQCRLVPVIVVEKAEEILPLGEALVKGGLPVAEVTFRSPAAADAIRLLKKEMPEVLLGAGTVLTKEQIDTAADAGAAFIVSPGFNPVNVKYAMDKGQIMVPGINSPSEAEQAMAMGLDVLKFFPAENAGGVGMLKAMNAVYPNLRIMPTGGINPGNVNDYLALPNVIACGGSWMCKKDLISAGEFDKIEALVKEALAALN
ncbi:MAG: bifunctional 4-hydroxy-2-oxoglutarate aldolase/2-dehydro-3-deoxy-phosphogluconate aldolase [Spirochaetales bacterium]|nr:bifunctional 4-hydroxy-2-oxoglutarate aldolase/2-dehydro-3-deoxy-phosphogluconate aldolase [Spirochaetales bacterium]